MVYQDLQTEDRGKKNRSPGKKGAVFVFLRRFILLFNIIDFREH